MQLFPPQRKSHGMRDEGLEGVRCWIWAQYSVEAGNAGLTRRGGERAGAGGTWELFLPVKNAAELWPGRCFIPSSPSRKQSRLALTSGKGAGTVEGSHEEEGAWTPSAAAELKRGEMNDDGNDEASNHRRVTEPRGLGEATTSRRGSPMGGPMDGVRRMSESHRTGPHGRFIIRCHGGCYQRRAAGPFAQ